MTPTAQSKFQIKIKEIKAKIAYALAPEVGDAVKELAEKKEQLHSVNADLLFYKSRYFDAFVVALCRALGNEKLNVYQVSQNLSERQYDDKLYAEIVNQLNSGKMTIIEYKNNVVKFQNGILIDMKYGTLLCEGMSAAFFQSMKLDYVKKLIMERLYKDYTALQNKQKNNKNIKGK